jgi:hypothetical protein
MITSKAVRLAKLATFAAFLSGTVALTTPASAIPIVTLDGISVPSNTAPGGNFVAGQLPAMLSQMQGNTLRGFVGVTDIADASGNPTYQFRFNIDQLSGIFLKAPALYGVFDDFNVDENTPATATTPGRITFLGGFFNYYLFDHDAAQPFSDSDSADTKIANIKGGTPWLNLVADTIDAAGHTLIVTIPAGGSLTNGASGELFLDVLGPGTLAANVFFNNYCGFVNAYGSGECSSLHLTAASGGPNFETSGSTTLRGLAQNAVLNSADVPEPGTLLLLGTGLLCIAGSTRRRKRS